MNAAIITARGGSKSIPRKNLLLVCGKPCLVWQIEAAKEARKVHRVFCLTDDDEIIDVASAAGAEIIIEPDWGCEGDHQRSIPYAVAAVKKLDAELDLVAVLLGNTAMTTGTLIDECLHLLRVRPDLTGCMTVWRAQDDHPYRAMWADLAGHLRPWSEKRGVGTNRQGYPPVYYYDNRVWAFRAAVAEMREGPAPWTWMGARCAPVVKPWITGRDIHGPLDIWANEQYRARIKELEAHAE